MKRELNLPILNESVCIPIDDIELEGVLAVPPSAVGIVLMASCDSAHSTKGKFLAERFVNNGFAMLSLNLLSEDEQLADAQTGHHRFDIAVLEERLTAVVDWLAVNHSTAGLNIGLFACDTSAGAAIITAVRRKKWISAIAFKSGRPDLAAEAVAEIECPTLFIVGEDDHQTLKLNKKALALMNCPKSLEVIHGAGHTFEEFGTIEQVARVSEGWFHDHLS